MGFNEIYKDILDTESNLHDAIENLANDDNYGQFIELNTAFLDYRAAVWKKLSELQKQKIKDLRVSLRISIFALSISAVALILAIMRLVIY